MKKKLITTLCLLSVLFVTAQEAAEKKLQAGILFGTGLNFNSPDTDLIERDGVGFDFIAGMSLDWHFSKNIALTTGIQFDFNRFRYNFTEPVYIDYKDRVVQRKRDGINRDATILMQNRRTRNVYMTIPTMLKFQTNYMGYMRYFGKFGVRNSFLLSSRGDLTGLTVNHTDGTIGGTVERDDMMIPNDVSWYRGAAGISAGAEWNFAGSTCIVAELGYFIGFTNIHSGDRIVGSDPDHNKAIYKVEDISGYNNLEGREYTTAKAMQGMLLLKVSLLF